MSKLIPVFLMVVCGVLFQAAEAAVIEVDVTIKSVDVASRTISVTFETNAGKKSNDLDVCRKAEITVNGRPGTLDSVKSGQKATVTFEKQLQVVTKIDVKDGSPGHLRDDRRTGQRLIQINGKPVYLHGVNLAWLDGGYGHDIGISPEHPDWGCVYNSQHLSSYLADMRRMNLNVVRVWLFEGLEGLTFDDNGLVSHIDPTFQRNVTDILHLADQHHIALYLCLGSDFRKSCQRLRVKDIESDVNARTAYLTNAVIPLVKLCQGKPYVFAFDIYNEPEQDIKGRTGNLTDDGCSWETMRQFIKANAAAIHQADPSRIVSCGSGWRGWENVASGHFSGLGLDFHDIHVYFDDNQLPPVSVFPDNIPVIVGEYGQSKKVVDYTLQETVARTVLRDAVARGYAGTLIFYYNYPNTPKPCEFDLLVGRGSGEWRPVCRVLESFTAPTQTPARYDQRLSDAEQRLVGRYKVKVSDSATGQPLPPYMLELCANRLVQTKDGLGWWCVEDNIFSAWFPSLKVEPVSLRTGQPLRGIAIYRKTKQKINFTLLRTNTEAQ